MNFTTSFSNSWARHFGSMYAPKGLEEIQESFMNSIKELLREKLEELGNHDPADHSYLWNRNILTQKNIDLGLYQGKQIKDLESEEIEEWLRCFLQYASQVKTQKFTQEEHRVLKNVEIQNDEVKINTMRKYINLCHQIYPSQTGPKKYCEMQEELTQHFTGKEIYYFPEPDLMEVDKETGRLLPLQIYRLFLDVDMATIRTHDYIRELKVVLEIYFSDIM